MPLIRGKRELIARALGKPLLQPFGRAFAQPGLMGLTYHRICDFDTLDPGVISASFDEFEWQLSFVKESVRVLSGPEVAQLARGEIELREPALCITFDDGYYDNLAAGRILARHNLPAVFFVTTGFIGSNTITHWDRIAYSTRRTEARTLEMAAIEGHGPWKVQVYPTDEAGKALRAIYYGLPTALQEPFVSAIEQAAGVCAKDAVRDEPIFMRWDDVRQLKAMGHEIGAHTHSHPILSQLDEAGQRAELLQSRGEIKRELGDEPLLLAYPNGKQWTFTQSTKHVARDTGFAAAFSFYGGRNEPETLDAFDIKRVWVSPTESRDLFRARVTFPQLLA